MRFFNYIIISLFIVSVVSCDVQKRRYQKGFYVSSRHAKATAQPKAEMIEHQVEPQTPNDATIFADASVGVTSKFAGTISKQIPPPTDTCDVLLFRDGSEIYAKITEVNNLEVRYKRCDNLTGPDFLTRRSDLFMIKYSNGTREVMKEEVQSQRQVPARTNSAPRQDYSNGPTAMHPAATAALWTGIISTVSLIVSIFWIYAMISAVSGAISAIRKYSQFNKQDRAQPGAYSGRGRAVTGLIFAIITLAIIFLILLILLLLIL